MIELAKVRKEKRKHVECFLVRKYREIVVREQRGRNRIVAVTRNKFRKE